MLRPSLEGLVIASSLPDQPENITFSRKLSIEEPSNKLVILGSVAGVLATSMLIVALYAPHSGGAAAARCQQRRGSAALCSLLLAVSPSLIARRERVAVVLERHAGVPPLTRERAASQDEYADYAGRCIGEE